MKKLTFDRRTKFVLMTFLFSIGTMLNAIFHIGWWLSTLLTAIVGALYVWYIIRYKDPVLLRLVLFGLPAGFIELFADCWGVKVGGLTYFPGGPFLMCSPLYMPFAWALLMVQFGYVGWWLASQIGMGPATALTALLGAINIPGYEYMAKSAHLWLYNSPPMLFDIVPYYVILAEALICLVLPFTLTWLEKKNWGWSLVLGTAQGFWMWGAGVLSFYLFRLI